MKIKPWKTLNRTVILEHPRMQLVEDTVELPDGKTTNYLRQAPAKTHSVAVIAINDKQEVLIQKEYSYPPNKVMWQPPGGGIHEGEDIIVAANRELSEESGFVARTSCIIGSYYVNNRRSDERQYVVLCKNLEPKSSPKDDEEFIESYWISATKVRTMIVAGEIDNINLLAALNLWFCLEGME